MHRGSLSEFECTSLINGAQHDDPDNLRLHHNTMKAKIRINALNVRVCELESNKHRLEKDFERNICVAILNSLILN